MMTLFKKIIRISTPITISLWEVRMEVIAAIVRASDKIHLISKNLIKIPILILNFSNKIKMNLNYRNSFNKNMRENNVIITAF